jgi:hypothetical protein
MSGEPGGVNAAATGKDEVRSQKDEFQPLAFFTAISQKATLGEDSP